MNEEIYSKYIMNTFGNYRLTKDRNFAIYTRNAFNLYMNTKFLAELDKSSPLSMLIESGRLMPEDTPTVLKNRDDIQLIDENGDIEEFIGYTFFRELKDNRTIDNLNDSLNESDCLNFSEFLTCENKISDSILDIQLLPYHYNTSALKFKHVTGRNQFGVSDKQNVRLTKRIDEEFINNQANPEMGESYAIVKNELPEENQTPYHIAYVVYKNGSINITFEATANDNLSETVKTYKPLFSFYSTDPKSRHTFHKYYQRRYTPMPMTTVTLEPRDPKTIINELMKETMPKIQPKTQKKKKSRKRKTQKVKN